VPPARRRHAEVSMVEVIAWQFPEYFAELTLGGPDRTADESRLDHAAPHDLYRCAGADAWLAVAVETDDEWRRLVEALGSPASLAGPRFAAHADRLAHLDCLDEALGAVLAGRDRDETFALLQAARVACAPVWGASELVVHPHMLERGILQLVRHPVWGERLLAGLPWQVVGEGPIRISAPPTLGEHTSDDPAKWWR
jgi:benzylsuccinate CoA-transferase BbsF subunit